jgi:DNA polymerase III alpha subunit
MPAVGLTDHNLLTGVVEFVTACKEADIQPVIGLEIDLNDGPVSLLAAHPLELAADKLSGTGALSTLEAAARVGQRVTIAGEQQASHRSLTTRGATVLFLSVEDLLGTLDAILFPEVYRQARPLISSSIPFLLTGTMEMYTERGEPFLRAERISSL